MNLEELRKIEKKWQKKWAESRIFEANPDESRKKFFITVPYPYVSGPLHIGHGRTYTLGDVIARYKRLRGYNVLYPMAFHITGTPIAAISDRIARCDKNYIELYKKYVAMYESDEKKIEEIVKGFVDPFNVATYFAERIHIDFSALGYSIDWRRKFHTGERIYNKFVEWQYHKLRDIGVLKRGTHYVTYCLLHKQPEGEDDIADADVNPVHIVEFVAIKFRYEDGYLLASTLRPETIFGATNLWVKPDAKYVKIDIEGEKFYVSEEASIKLRHQYDNVKIVEENIPGYRFIGKYVEDPFGRKLIILPADFVDPDVATGFVYSEPADAPYDYVALQDLKRNPEILEKYRIDPEVVMKIEPIKIIDVPGVKGFHAGEVVKKMGIRDQYDERLEEATKIVYKEQYYEGKMNERTGEFAGLPVKEAKEKVKEYLIKNGKALIMYETSRKAICRAGGKIIVAKISDQWFIDYSPEWWKEKTRKWLEKMLIYPEKYKQMFYDTVDWLRQRPCARKRGLGTRLPFDPEWIIESLSDSTIYMAFYTIVHHIREKKIRPEQLTLEFFDYVFLGKGNAEEVSNKTGIPKEWLEEMRREFNYWYPVDLRHTAIPHISNHLTFFIMHHIAIFPQDKWPLAITLNELVIREGKKMSKSKGNVIPLREVAENLSADLFRLYTTFAADFDTILDWRGKELESVKGRLLRFAELALNAAELKDVKMSDDIPSRWFISLFYKKLRDSAELMDSFRIRDFVVQMFFEVLRDYAYLERRVGKENALRNLRIILKDWAIVLSPVIPHLAEEIWEKLGEKGFVSVAEWPRAKDDLIDERAIILEEIVRGILEDYKEIVKAIRERTPTKAIFIVAASWKRDVMKEIVNAEKQGILDMKTIMKNVMKREKLRKKGKQVAQFVSQVLKKRELIIKYVPSQEEELNLLMGAKDFLRKELGISVEIVREEDAKGLQKAKYAVPGRPGIQLEF